MDDPPLPMLRQELRLYTAPAGIGGAPSWTVYDPATNRFFQIGIKVYEILSHWNGGTPQRVVARVNEMAGLSITEQDVLDVANFIRSHNLTQLQSAEDTQQLIQGRKKRQVGWLKWLLMNYLFLRIPLIYPERILARTYPWVAWLYRPWVRWFVLTLGGVGLYLAGRQWDHFFNTLTDLFSLEGMFWFAIALFFAKVIHELGHAYTAHRYGCRVASMGVAFLVMWPVLYTDVTDAWKLSSRRARIAISSAGMIAELAIALIATLLWSFMPDGLARSAVFLIATTTWIGTLAINAMPFLRFDGYYLLSDILRIDNLFERAFALGRWRLRETLFGLGEQPPERLSSVLQRFLIVFSFAVWLYRLFLFLGIAVLVYYFFFKALGVILFAVELWWFILRPVMGELTAWWRVRNEVRFNLRSATTLSVLFILLGLFFIPWRSDISISAVMIPVESSVVFSPRAARIKSIDVGNKEHVSTGQRLMQLEAPSMAYQIRRAEQQRKLLQWEIARAGSSGRLSARRMVSEEELRTVEENLAGLIEAQDQLNIRAPFAGKVIAKIETTAPGQWLPAQMPLFKLIGESAGVIKGYLPEDELWRIQIGSDAVFYPDIPEIPPIDCRLSAVDDTSAKVLDPEMLAERHGGMIATRHLGEGEVVPKRAHYRIYLDTVVLNNDQQQMILRGVVTLPGRSQSLAQRAWQTVYGVLIRESGF